MSYTHQDLQQLIEKWGAKGRHWMTRDYSLTAVRVANAYFDCVDDLIDLTTPTANELRQSTELTER